MSERRGTKALELWCRRITEGYPGVNIQNMTTSWRDGLAFCAMIHHFRPDLIDFDSLNKDDIYGNNELAFRTAEQHLGIPALLDAEDMASCAVPDRLSILTYLSQFYQTFGGSSPSRLAMNRTTESASERITPVTESPQPKAAVCSGMRREQCAVCGLPVFLAEKLVVARSPYHRTCFRCARCRNQLTPGNYYETEDGEFCCETCPDEEPMTRRQQTANSDSSPCEPRRPSFSDKPLSDEEKSSLGIRSRREAERSCIPDQISQRQRMRLDLMTSHLLSDKMDELSMVDGFLPGDKSLESDPAAETPSSPRFKEKAEKKVDEEVDDDKEEEIGNDEHVEDDSDAKDDNDGNEESEKEDETVVNSNILDTVEIRRHDNQHPTAISSHDVEDKGLGVKENTKETFEDKPEEERPLSLVQQRLRMFECRQTKPDKDQVPVTSTRLSSTDATKILEPPDSLKASRDRVIAGDNEPLDRTVTETDLSTRKDLSDSEEYPEALNPFNDDEETGEGNGDTSKRQSINPFDSDEDDEGGEEDRRPPRPAARTCLFSERAAVNSPTKRLLQAPQVNLNPFWSDEEQEEDCDDTWTEAGVNPTAAPVPKPRTIKQTETSTLQRKSELSRDNIYASNTSINSAKSTATLDSIGGSTRKKKPAPQPPTSATGFSSPDQTIVSPAKSLNSSVLSGGESPRTTPRMRKAKPAPPPPISSSTSNVVSEVTSQTIRSECTIPVTENTTTEMSKSNTWTDEKLNKDEANRNRQSVTCMENPTYMSFPDKSVEGKWKRKKGPAPPRPVPHRRKIKVISIKDVKLEMDEIELQQQGLEKQGVRLEKMIRDKCETKHGEDTNLDVDVEELVLELFALVNEKNELFRRQAELMLLRRQYRLEEEHADIEYQIRCLMCQPEATKTDFDKQREEALIQRLVEIVERRNEIVECLEMDRKREVEEDRSIHKQMGLFAAKNKGQVISDNNETIYQKSKKSKVKGKFKEKKLKKDYKEDADKDVDEAEAKPKRHIKRKWF